MSLVAAVSSAIAWTSRGCAGHRTRRSDRTEAKMLSTSQEAVAWGTSAAGPLTVSEIEEAAHHGRHMAGRLNAMRGEEQEKGAEKSLRSVANLRRREAGMHLIPRLDLIFFLRHSGLGRSLVQQTLSSPRRRIRPVETSYIARTLSGEGWACRTPPTLSPGSPPLRDDEMNIVSMQIKYLYGSSTWRSRPVALRAEEEAGSAQGRGDDRKSDAGSSCQPKPPPAPRASGGARSGTGGRFPGEGPAIGRTCRSLGQRLADPPWSDRRPSPRFRA